MSLSKVIKQVITLASTISICIGSKMALAADSSNKISDQTAETVSQKVVDIVSGLLQPFGGAVIFVAIAICAFQIITTSHKPRERAEAMSALPYILGGGILLGGSLIAAGFVMGLYTQAGSSVK